MNRYAYNSVVFIGSVSLAAFSGWVMGEGGAPLFLLLLFLMEGKKD
jgi:hypothetical protein